MNRLEEEAARKLQDRLAAELEHLPTDDLIPQVMTRVAWMG